MKLKLHKLLKSWQIFNAIKEEFGIEYLLKLWGFKHARQIYKWCADPRAVEDSAPNPIDKIQVMLEDLNRIGRRDIALQAIKCLARPLGFEVKDPKNIRSDKEDITLEFLDASSALGETGKAIQEAIEDNVITQEEAEAIQEFVDKAITELLQMKDALRKNTLSDKE